jgi:hypothetical protein
VTACCRWKNQFGALFFKFELAGSVVAARC